MPLQKYANKATVGAPENIMVLGNIGTERKTTYFVSSLNYESNITKVDPAACSEEYLGRVSAKEVQKLQNQFFVDVVSKIGIETKQPVRRMLNARLTEL